MSRVVRVTDPKSKNVRKGRTGIRKEVGYKVTPHLKMRCKTICWVNGEVQELRVRKGI